MLFRVHDMRRPLRALLLLAACCVCGVQALELQHHHDQGDPPAACLLCQSATAAAAFGPAPQILYLGNAPAPLTGPTSDACVPFRPAPPARGPPRHS